MTRPPTTPARPGARAFPLVRRRAGQPVWPGDYAALERHIEGSFHPRPQRAGPPRSGARAGHGAVQMIETRYQPVVRIADGRPTGFEVLARLNHPLLGLLPPDRFIPGIETAGLSAELTEVVIARAFTDLGAGILGDAELGIGINMPLDVLLHPATLARMEWQRDWAQIPAERVIVELTESRPVTDLPGLGVAVARWRKAGYRVAIDDVGPAMPNHRSLIGLPFTTVKLDKGLVQSAARDRLARQFADEVIAAAHQRGMLVIAEGVESEATWRCIRGRGVDRAQGWLIAPPLAARELPAWMNAWRRRQPELPDQTAR